MCVEVERPRLAEGGERALHQKPLAPVELGAEPLTDLGQSARPVFSIVAVADDFRHLSPRGRLHGAGEAADGLH